MKWSVMAVAVLASLVLVAGCGPARSGHSDAADAVPALMVPDVPGLNIVLFGKQEAPTAVPRSWLGTVSDVAIVSGALWGVVESDASFAIAGSGVAPSADAATAALARMPFNKTVTYFQDGVTVYGICGKGPALDKLKAALVGRAFVPCADAAGLAAMETLPSAGGQAVRGFVIPNATMIGFVERFIGTGMSAQLDNAVAFGNLRALALGLYSPQAISPLEVVRRFSDQTLADMDLAVVTSIVSSYPGLVFAPVATGFLDRSGLKTRDVNGRTVYVASYDVWRGRKATMLATVEGNCVVVAAGFNAAYASELLAAE